MYKAFMTKMEIYIKMSQFDVKASILGTKVCWPWSFMMLKLDCHSKVFKGLGKYKQG